jgi:hypothetical protein
LLTAAFAGPAMPQEYQLFLRIFLSGATGSRALQWKMTGERVLLQVLRETISCCFRPKKKYTSAFLEKIAKIGINASHGHLLMAYIIFFRIGFAFNIQVELGFSYMYTKMELGIIYMYTKIDDVPVPSQSLHLHAKLFIRPKNIKKHLKCPGM